MTDPLALLAYLVSHPDIIRWVAPGRSHVDVSSFDKEHTYIFGDSYGAVLFDPLDPEKGHYEMHYLFTCDVRGKVALTRIREAVKIMFTDHGATVIGGAVPREHRASRVMSRALGARSIGSHTDSYGRACITYVLERVSWAQSSADS